MIRPLTILIVILASTLQGFSSADAGGTNPLPPGYPDRSATFDALPGFLNPPPGYGDVPFYWWMGDTLTRERIAWQLDQLKGHGVTGLQVNYAHSDSGGLIWGLTYPSKPRLFSEEWWNLYRWFLDEAKKRDMSVSLSDYTLGHAGQGWFIDSMLARVPSLAGTRLVADTLLCHAGRQVSMPVASGVLIAKAYKVVGIPGAPRISVELQARIKNGTLTWTPPAGAWTIVVVRKEVVPTAISPLHPESGKELIANFFQKFEDHCPGEGGKGLNFFFSDELDFGIRGYLWDPAFPAEFQRRKKYLIVPQLAALFIDIGPGTPKIRMDYDDVMVMLSEDHFFKPVYDWHTSRGMVFGCDHGGRGKDVTEFGDYFRTQRWMSGPGCDQPRLEKDIVKAKVASSIAHLYDRPRTWLEGFHSSNWGTSSGQVADAIFANYALGHNLLSLHGLYYSTHGGWWEWAPPDNHWRQPYWNQMTGLMKCTERLSYLLSQGRHVCDVAVAYPVAPTEAGISGDGAVECAFSTAEAIYRGGWDLDFIDFSSIAASKVKEAALSVSGERYRVLILPAMKAVRFSTMEKALEFYRGGGIVVAVGSLPIASDRMGRHDRKLESINMEIFGQASGAETGDRHRNSKGGVGIVLADPAAVPGALQSLLSPDVRVSGASKPFYQLHRRIGTREVYFVYGAPAGSECTLRSSGNVELWNPWDGSVKSLPVLSQNALETRLRLPLAETEPQLIVFSQGKAVVASAAAATSADTMALDNEWGFELKPMLDNRWGDFRLPAFNGNVGAEAWKVRWSQGAPTDTLWRNTEFDDSGWERVSISYGPRMYRLGPMPVTADSSSVEKLLSHLDEVDPSVPVMAGGKPYRWTPVEFSWRWGIPGDAGHQGYHGLKAEVHDELIENGTPNRDWPGVPIARLLPDSAGQRVYYWSTVFAPNDCRAAIERRGLLPSASWIDHRQISAETWGVDLRKGPTRVLFRYDTVGRSCVVFRDRGLASVAVGRVPLATRWYGDPSVLQFEPMPGRRDRIERFRIQAPPGLNAVTFSAKDRPRVWVDGEPVAAALQSPDPLKFPDQSVPVWRCKLGVPRDRMAIIAIEAVSEPGTAGGAVFPEPIRFECARGTISLADLSTVEPLRTYSGGMMYRKSFRMSRVRASGRSILLDLGSLVSSAEVRVNGRSAGIRCSPPWRFDVTTLAREGDNEVEVELYNTLANYYLTTPTPFVGLTASGLVGPVRVVIE
jgi:hypothetical protein